MTYQTFDPDSPLVLFDDYDKAKAYLHWLWENAYNTEMAEGSMLIEQKCWHEDELAKITWSDGDYMEFILTGVSEPNEEFNDTDWRNYV